jgi:hypothetical protein
MPPYPLGYTGLDKNWEANLAAIITALQPLVANNTIVGVFLGDEGLLPLPTPLLLLPLYFCICLPSPQPFFGRGMFFKSLEHDLGFIFGVSIFFVVLTVALP